MVSFVVALERFRDGNEGDDEEVEEDAPQRGDGAAVASCKDSGEKHREGGVTKEVEELGGHFGGNAAVGEQPGKEDDPGGVTGDGKNDQVDQQQQANDQQPPAETGAEKKPA